MTMRDLTLIAVLPVIAACTVSADKYRTLTIAECTTVGYYPPCEAEQPAQITITPGAISVAPPTYCARPGDTVRFRVVNPAGNASIAVVPADPFNIWLYGSNAVNAQEFTVVVPDDAALGWYKFFVYGSDGNCLDPMIHVDR